MKRRSSVGKSKVAEVQEVKNDKVNKQAKQQPSTTSSDAFLKPQIQSEVNVFRKKLKMKIFLPKVPSKFINLNMEEKNFEIDTKDFSRKFHHKSDYPDNVHVSTQDVDVSHAKDCLEIVANVTFVPEATKEKYDKLEEQKREARKIKFAPPTQKKVVEEKLAKDEKKAERRKRQKEKIRFHETQQDLAPKKRKLN